MPTGIKGTIDWIGYPVGEPPPPAPSGGFRGLLDFVGFSVGSPSTPSGPPIGSLLMMGVGK